RAVRLETVDADFLRGVHRPAGFGEERRDVTARAARGAGERRLTALRGLRIEAAFGRRRRRNRERVGLGRREWSRAAVFTRRLHVSEPGARGNRELRRIVEPRIVERAG